MEKLIFLIQKKLTGGLKGKESQELDALLKDADHRLVAEQVEKVWENTKTYKKDFEPNVEAGLSKFKARIQKEQTPEVKVVKIVRRRWLTQVAAAVLLLAGSWFAWNTFNTVDEQLVTSEKIETVRLADNTAVTVNRSSALSYPTQFSSSERNVELDGEAFFDVAKNPDQPFIIQTGNFQVKVLGTSFNVRNYDHEDVVEVTVRSGKVEVSSGSQKWILEANDQLSFDKKKKKVNQVKVDNLNAIAWSTKALSFQNENLEKVKETIERVYNVKIEISERSLLKCPYTTTLKDESLENILDVLTVAFEMDAFEKISENKYRLIGGVCRNNK